jgi:hypothetical protein
VVAVLTLSNGTGARPGELIRHLARTTNSLAPMRDLPLQQPYAKAHEREQLALVRFRISQERIVRCENVLRDVGRCMDGIARRGR